jgi:hypothetical protein
VLISRILSSDRERAMRATKKPHLLARKMRLRNQRVDWIRFPTLVLPSSGSEGRPIARALSPGQDQLEGAYCGGRFSRSAGLFSFGLLDVFLRIRLCRPHLREAADEHRPLPPRDGMFKLILTFRSPSYRQNGIAWVQPSQRVIRPSRRRSDWAIRH